MDNYFRITAYHPVEDFSAIIDSYGLFDKLWQFSAYLVEKGFKIIAVGNDEQFLDGNFEKPMRLRKIKLFFALAPKAFLIKTIIELKLTASITSRTTKHFYITKGSGNAPFCILNTP